MSEMCPYRGWDSGPTISGWRRVPSKLGRLYRDKENSVEPDRPKWAGGMDGVWKHHKQITQPVILPTRAPPAPHFFEEVETSPGCFGSEASTEFNPEGTTGLWNDSLTPS